VCKGVEKMTLNGKEIKSNLIPADQMTQKNQVEVWLA
jgi:hypothetical protein